MDISEVPYQEPAKGIHIPRWSILIIWIVFVPLVHIVFPWRLSLLATRHGWVEGHPGVWNLPTWLLILASFAGILWCLKMHFVHVPHGVKLEMTPKYLLQQGPYRYTRNPMYLSAIGLWLGWTLFYGSAAVLIGLLVIWMFAALVAVPREEIAWMHGSASIIFNIIIQYHVGCKSTATIYYA